MSGVASKVLFVVAFGLCIVLLFFPFAQITKEKTNVVFVKHVDYYLWGVHIYGSGTFEPTDNTWILYINPKTSDMNTFLAISFMLLLAGLVMGLLTIYYYLKKPDVAPTFSWLVIIPFALSSLFFRIGIEDVKGYLLSVAKVYDYEISSTYYASFYIFILGVILMLLSYGLSYVELPSRKHQKIETEVKTEETAEEIKMETGKKVKREISKGGYIALGLLFGVISLVFFPIIFGPATIFCGYKIFSKWDERIGLGIMIFGACCMIVGILLGYYFAMKYMFGPFM